MIKTKFIITDEYALLTVEESKEILAYRRMVSSAHILPDALQLPDPAEDIEGYAWENPILSRKDVYELFESIMSNRHSASIKNSEIDEFRRQLRNLSREKATDIRKSKSLVDFKPEFEIETNEIVRFKIVDQLKDFQLGDEYLNISPDPDSVYIKAKGKIWRFPTRLRFETVSPKKYKLKVSINPNGKKEVYGKYIYK